MHMIFYDMNGVILRWPVLIGTTINAQYYKKVLQDKLRPAIRKKRPGLSWSPGILFHHDNAPSPYGPGSDRRFGWLQVGTAGASSAAIHLTLLPVIFTYSLKMKEHLRGQRFGNRRGHYSGYESSNKELIYET
ncbi:hypothetical protein RRG08_005771, partial [Elysia crispata]